MPILKNPTIIHRTEYAKTKYVGELNCDNTDLIVRTSFVGRKKTVNHYLIFTSIVL